MVLWNLSYQTIEFFNYYILQTCKQIHRKLFLFKVTSPFVFSQVNGGSIKHLL